ncbi:hypothetical protein JCM18920_3142 [Cutibacterium acnes JCM 18920]|nr:hypothetical protein JCM18920_3142 [Cutibacterium acnes JCM 18920]
MHPLGRAAAKRLVRNPAASMATISPGSISRTKVPPTMSIAAVSEATTQPLDRRPSTNGRMPCGSRAAHKVWSSMKTRLKAPEGEAGPGRQPPQECVIGRHEGCYQRGVAAGVHPVLVGNLGIRGTLSDEGFEGAGVGEVAVMGQS